MLEKQITKKIKSYLNSLEGVFVWKTHGNQFSCPGVPDIIGTFKGRLIAVEVKRPGKVPTKLQQAFIDKLNATGAISFVATCVEDVEKELSI